MLDLATIPHTKQHPSKRRPSRLRKGHRAPNLPRPLTSRGAVSSPLQLIARMRKWWRIDPELADVIRRNRKALEAQRAA